jgi:hypothetical protein
MHRDYDGPFASGSTWKLVMSLDRRHFALSLAARDGVPEPIRSTESTLRVSSMRAAE